MCSSCPPWEVTLAGIAGNIEEGHPALMTVTGDHLVPSWTYTIGLTELFDHPEVVWVGGCMGCGYGVVGQIVEAVMLDCEHSDSGATFTTDGGHDILLRGVHPSHWRTSRFNAWRFYYEGQAGPPQRAAVQAVFDPADWHCHGAEPGVAKTQTRLDLPALRSVTNRRRHKTRRR